MRTQLERWDSFAARAKDLAELAAIADDPTMSADLERDLATLGAEVAQATLEAQLSSPYDERDAVVAISAGVGGTDAADWAQMLVRMYLRWAERRGYKAEIIETTPGDEAGIRSATLTIEGLYAYGYLRTERGTHRLVRISPRSRACSSSCSRTRSSSKRALRMRIAVSRFCNCDRSFWQETTMPLGRCVMRTAVSVLLTFCPPAPVAR